ncbi:MAG: ABC-2 family transporter protein [Oscillospiraceae bacterium]|nr:ABC-2 family transporter protein [Oscillospiraceae bacterium]
MRLYMKFFSMHMKSQMQYKLSFFLTMIGQFLVSFAILLSLYFMMSRFNVVMGFTYEQVLLCFASVLMGYSLAEMLGRGFDLFPRMLGNGEFDRALVRPRSVITQVLASKMDFTRLGRILQAAFVFIYAVPKSGVIWTRDKILTLFLMVICGSLVFFGLFIVYAAFSFFTVEGLEFMNILTDGGREFGRYPYAIYGEGILKFLTYFVPLALFQYYPLLYLLDIEKSKLYMFTPLLSLIFLLPAYAFFQYGVRKYKSTGS